MAIKDVILGYAKGDKGDRGPQGEKGATGATGPKGEPGNIADAQITDTEGLDVAKGQKTTVQKLFDAIANRIATKLVTNDALTKKLADYMLKGMMSNTNVNNTGTVPTSALMYSMFEQINSDLGYYITSVDDFSHTLIGEVRKNITLNSKITLGQYTRVLFMNILNSKDGALLAIAPGDKIITAFRNNGVWEEKSSHFIATKSDIQSGKFTIVGATTGEISSVRVNFSKPMRAVPRVVVSWQDNNNTFKTYGMLVADKVDVNGFTVSALATATTASSWYGSYIAICV